MPNKSTGRGQTKSGALVLQAHAQKSVTAWPPRTRIDIELGLRLQTRRKNHYKENSAILTNLLLIIVPMLQSPEVTVSSRSQNKVDYLYNLSMHAIRPFMCV